MEGVFYQSFIASIYCHIIGFIMGISLNNYRRKMKMSNVRILFPGQKCLDSRWELLLKISVH